MASIKIETGLKTYDIEDEYGNIRGQITINPRDVGFFERAQTMANNVLHYLDDIDDVDENDNDEKILDIFTRTDKTIKEELDKLFGDGTSTTVFGEQSSISTINGVTFIERFLSAFMPIIKAEFEKEMKNSSVRIDKYVKQVTNE